MSQECPSPEFWKRADAVIHLANEQCGEAPLGEVSSSILYAAARFNAFIVASAARDLDEMKANREEAIDYFPAQYKKMLIENLDDYIENFDNYRAEEDAGHGGDADGSSA
jgi:hypothetical protein